MTNTAAAPRRVVVSPGPLGADVVYDNIVVSVETAAATISDVWLTERQETTTDGNPASAAWSLLPAQNGTTWRIVEFKGGRTPADLTAGMHQTPTVDMGVILSGRIWLVLEDASTVELTAGDFFVLRGVQHTWANPGKESCVMSIVLVRSQ
jgi:quercetin dioxygenase-like cupin family protein